MGQLNKLAGVVQVQRLAYNTVVVEQGSYADCTYFIKTGEVRVVRCMQATTPFWARLHKDPLLGPRYAPTSHLKHRSRPFLLWHLLLAVFTPNYHFFIVRPCS